MSGPTSVDVFDLGSEHEQVVFANDPATGLKAIIAIHSTALGPALGGTRFYPYASDEAALEEQLYNDPDFLFERLTNFGATVAGETRQRAILAIRTKP